MHKFYLVPVTKRSILLFNNFTASHLGRIVTKQTKWHVSPAKTQISLGIHPVWSASSFAVRLKQAWVLGYPLSAQRRVRSDWADTQADLSLRWAHMPFCWFCHDAAHLIFSSVTGLNCLSENTNCIWVINRNTSSGQNWNRCSLLKAKNRRRCLL